MKHNMVVRALAHCLTVLALWNTALPKAKAQQIVVSPNQDVNQVEQLGFPTQYYIFMPNPQRPMTVVWSYVQTDCAAPGPSISAPKGTFLNPGNFDYPIPGTFEIRAAITFGRIPVPGDVPPPPTTITKTVTIAPPRFMGVLGDNTPTDYMNNNQTMTPTSSPRTSTSLGGVPGNWIYFTMRSNSRIIGISFSPKVQEKLTQWKPMKTYIPLTYFEPADGDWRPNNTDSTNPNDNGPDNRFVYVRQVGPANDVAIADFKYSTPLYWGGNVIIDDNLLTYTQENRVSWNDFNDKPVPPVSLGVTKWKESGISATQMKMTYTQDN